MSIEKYLKTLSIDQLYFAEEKCKELIGHITSQDKIKLFVIDNGLFNVACFSYDDFDKAREKLCEVIMEDGIVSRKVKQREMPSISLVSVYASEVEDLMSLND